MTRIFTLIILTFAGLFMQTVRAERVTFSNCKHNPGKVERGTATECRGALVDPELPEDREGGSPHMECRSISSLRNFVAVVYKSNDILTGYIYKSSGEYLFSIVEQIGAECAPGAGDEIICPAIKYRARSDLPQARNVIHSGAGWAIEVDK